MGIRGLLAVAVVLAVALVGCAQGPATAAPVPTSTPAGGPAPSVTPLAGAGRTGTPGASSGGTRVSGSVQSVDGDKITLSDGSVITAGAQTRITRQEAIAAADLKPGLYVAVTAQRQPDNTLLASAVNVFDESLRGVAPGQRPMTGGNLMTNATIDKVSGDTFTVTWDGGGANVRIAPDAKVTRIAMASLSDLKPGAMISAVEGSGGLAQSISLQ